MAEIDKQRGQKDDGKELPLATLTLTEAEYNALRSALSPEIRRRGRRQESEPDFIFNVGLNGEIFPYTTTGHTRSEDRTDLRGQLPILDRIGIAAVEGRGEAGRFFGNTSGIHYKDREKRIIQCLRFQIRGATK